VENLVEGERALGRELIYRDEIHVELNPLVEVPVVDLGIGTSFILFIVSAYGKDLFPHKVAHIAIIFFADVFE
jgi:hypothetical protein